jgi:TM2 domain-containing membrane protein YozV
MSAPSCMDAFSIVCRTLCRIMNTCESWWRRPKYDHEFRNILFLTVVSWLSKKYHIFYIKNTQFDRGLICWIIIWWFYCVIFCWCTRLSFKFAKVAKTTLRMQRVFVYLVLPARTSALWLTFTMDRVSLSQLIVKEDSSSNSSKTILVWI